MVGQYKLEVQDTFKLRQLIRGVHAKGSNLTIDAVVFAIGLTSMWHLMKTIFVFAYITPTGYN